MPPVVLGTRSCRGSDTAPAGPRRVVYTRTSRLKIGSPPLHCQDEDKERETTETLLERVEVEDILELKQQKDEEKKIKVRIHPSGIPVYPLVKFFSRSL